MSIRQTDRQTDRQEAFLTFEIPEQFVIHQHAVGSIGCMDLSIASRYIQLTKCLTVDFNAMVYVYSTAAVHSGIEIEHTYRSTYESSRYMMIRLKSELCSWNARHCMK